MTARIHAIVNPNAGGGYASNVWPQVKNLRRAMGREDSTND